MARLSRICLPALALAFLVPATALAGSRPEAHSRWQAMPGPANPARLSRSVPLVPVPAPAPRPTLGERAVRIARLELGTPYRYGGSGPGGFDCSGLTSWVYGRLGIRLPHNAAAQYGVGHPVALRSLEPGDLVFFHGLGHVGLYIGGGRIIHAPQTGERVEIQPLSARSGQVEGARRVA
jgi:cell wall-associated NlpC family hydrolase